MIHVLFKFAKNPYGGTEIDVTSNSGRYASLSPFVLDSRKYLARRFENLWQFSKVYPDQVDDNGEPSMDWFKWRAKGFASDRAIRYPRGKGATPLYSYWNGEHLGYIQARKQIYAPVYAELAGWTLGYGHLEWLRDNTNLDIVLRDYDAYDHIAMGKSFREVINDPDRKCGHGFVLAMMLTGELEECVR